MPLYRKPTGSVTSVNGDPGPVVVIDQDEVLDGAVAKQYTDTEKTKLAGIAPAATANDTDANLKNRGNHTGTQTASTISDFATAADARVNTLVPAASLTAAGKVELATTAETTTGTDAIRAVTPAGVAAAIAASGGTLPFAYYNGTSWGTRPSVSTPVTWYSTAYPGAPEPPDLDSLVGDIWIAEP